MAGDKKAEDFSSFQIGGMPGFGPGTPKPAPSEAPAAAGVVAPTAPGARIADTLEPPKERRFPTLEELLESENDEIETFAEAMGETCQELDDLIEKRTGRVKEEAQKARNAYELVFSLLDELLEIKAYLMSPAEEALD